MENLIYNEDCIKTLVRLPENSVPLVVTSPPYFVNKEYEKEMLYDDYYTMMKAVFMEVERVLVGGGYFVVNFGDFFNSGNRFYEAQVPSCYPASLNYFHWGVDCAGMDLQATRIWRKRFAKMGIPFVCNTHPRPVFDYEHIWTFRKKGIDKKERVNDRKLSQRGVIGEDWKSDAGIDKHCAAFPVELPVWAIDVYSKEGDTVYDPFMGSGTTAIACILTERKYLGSEINTDFYELAIQRIQKFSGINWKIFTRSKAVEAIDKG